MRYYIYWSDCCISGVFHSYNVNAFTVFFKIIITVGSRAIKVNKNFMGNDARNVSKTDFKCRNWLDFDTIILLFVFFMYFKFVASE